MSDDFHNIMDDMEYQVTNTRKVTVDADNEKHDGVVITCTMNTDTERKFTENAQRRMEDNMGIEFVYGQTKDNPIKLD